MKQYVRPIQCAAVHTHTLAHTKKERKRIWTPANRNRPCVCVVSLHWNISLRDQIGFDPALWASESYGSSKCILSRVRTHAHHSKSEVQLAMYKSANRDTLRAGHAFTSAKGKILHPVRALMEGPVKSGISTCLTECCACGASVI